MPMLPFATLLNLLCNFCDVQDQLKQFFALLIQTYLPVIKRGNYRYKRDFLN